MLTLYLSSFLSLEICNLPKDNVLRFCVGDFRYVMRTCFLVRGVWRSKLTIVVLGGLVSEVFYFYSNSR